MPYLVALDARVLLPRPGRVDVALMHLASQEVYWPRWSTAILDDVRILWRKRYPTAPDGPINEQIDLLSEYEFGYDALVRPHPFLRSHEQARVDLAPCALHVLEAAAHAGAHAIITTAPGEFPEELVHGLVVHTVDEFLSGRLELHPYRYAKAFEIWARENREQDDGPPTVAGILDQLEPEAPMFAKEARARLLAMIPTSSA